MNTCTENKLNIGASECKKLPGLIKGMITTPENWSITAANAASQTNWQDAILAPKGTRIYLWPKWAVGMEDLSEEQIMEETPLTAIPVRAGQYRFRLMFRENLALHKAMYSHNNTAGRVFLIDNENKLIGTSIDEGVTLQGFLMDNLLVEKLKLGDGSVSSKTPIRFYLADNNELDANGYMIEPNFLSSLLPLTTVKPTVSAASATSITVSVKSILDSLPIIGLVAADFTLLTAAGLAQTISGATEPNDDGVYVLTGSGWVTGTLNLKAASALTLVGYESQGTVAVTIA